MTNPNSHMIIHILLSVALLRGDAAFIPTPYPNQEEVSVTAGIEPTISNCSTQEDLRFNGTLLNCSNLDIFRILAEWMPVNTTTALFDNNNIRTLPKDIFARAPDIVHLSLRDNGLNDSACLEALKPLEKLQILDLEWNRIRLDKIAWHLPYLEHLDKLKDLRLAYNGNDEGEYPELLLKGLTNLQNLTLDTFNGKLYLNSIFRNTPHLSVLFLVGNCSCVTNVTFISLKEIPLKELHLIDLPGFKELDLDAFRYLTSLHTLKIRKVDIGIKSLIQSLHPFKGKEFKSIHFAYTRKQVEYLFVSGSIVDEDTAMILGNIKLESLTLIKNCIFYLSRAILAGKLCSCLKHVLIDMNPMMGDSTTVWGMMQLPNLETFQISNAKYSLIDVGPDPPIAFWHAGKLYGNKRGEIIQSLYTTNNTIERDHVNKEITHKKVLATHASNGVKGQRGFQENRIVNVSNTLRVFRFFGMAHNTMSTRYNYSIRKGNNVKEFNSRDNNVYFYGGHSFRMAHAETLDFSWNNAKDITPDFFDYLPKLRHLNISHTKLNRYFMSLGSRRLFQNVIKLETLDLSRNHLQTLSPKTFDTLSNLSVLILAWNKFRDFPVSLCHLPKLKLLDLRENSIRTLSESSMATLEQCTKSHDSSLRIRLSGNLMSCRCRDIRFLIWLRRTSVNLDHDKNYTCVDEEGYLRYTASMDNFEAMWRKCQGWNFLMISLVLACLMLLAFCLSFLCIKFKTRFAAFCLAMTQTINGPDNYPLGVYIGYADTDVLFVRFLLAEYIEKKLGFSTYIRHRDLTPGKCVAESIVHAINSSWRILLIVSHDFLAQDKWVWFTMQTAIFSVQSANPGRVVVVVDESLKHRIPHCLLTAVHEENIVTIETRSKLSYEESQRLKDALV